MASVLRLLTRLTSARINRIARAVTMSTVANNNRAAVRAAPIVLSLEGSIGSGKSTFLQILKEKLGDDLEIFAEPVEEWKNVGEGGDNLLNLFYEDPKRWAYTFQSYAFVSRLMLQQKTLSESTKSVVVRSLLPLGDSLICH